MATNPEAVFRRYINTRLDERVYVEGMANPYRGGTPDNYYEARKALWVEYKFLKNVPKTLNLSKIVTSLQQLWLNRCVSNGHQGCVIIGFGKDLVLIVETFDWGHLYTREELLKTTITRKEAIQWIQTKVL